VIEDLLTPYHLLILFALLFFLFGAKRLPGLGKSLGHGIREFRGGLAGLSEDHDDELPEAAPEATADAQLTLAAADGSRPLDAGDEPPRPA
jgi:sec-independent protein translocase protein TatA